MTEVDVAAWVVQAPNTEQRSFREAIHIVLDAIGHSHSLQAKMVMKGGLLMAIRYDSTRYTRDIDFSTTEQYAKDGENALLVELEQQLTQAETKLGYGTTCKVQSHKVEPKGEGKTHQSLKLKIGYAAQGNANAMKRLTARTSPQVVEIDYSYNEAVLDVDVLELEGGITIRTYSTHNLIAEKLRSLLQQPVRNRTRRQDVYDVCLLLQTEQPQEADLLTIHTMLVASCQSKGIDPTRDSMNDDAVVQMARDGYASLKDDVEGELPPFDVAMGRVQDFYRALPWQ